MGTESIKILEKALKKDRYIQGFNANPIFLNHGAWSGVTMKKKLGFGYSEIALNYRDNYCEFGYASNDFKKIWSEIKTRQKINKDYLEKIRKKYLDEFANHEKFFKEIDKLADIRKLSNDDLIGYFKKCCQAQIDSIGIAHIIDAIGVEADKDFKEFLQGEITDKKEFNYYFFKLVSPQKLSFIAQEGADLAKISVLPKSQKAKAIKKHQKKYFWLQNSYAGAQQLNINFFLKRLAKARKKEKPKQDLLYAKKNFNPKIKDLAEIIRFSTAWQDERKAKALKTIGYFDYILQEISRRTGIAKKLLCYLGVRDSSKINSLADFLTLKSELEARFKSKGVFFLINSQTEFIFFGEDYKKLTKQNFKKSIFSNQVANDIRGAIANGGTAIGRVIVCKGISSIDKVKKGDILVASMTRPEFMSALKKAAAIITDEGGITSHAAIIARELNIPAIIGTKVATKVLCDGMLVEVKANHGVVKILK